MVFFFKKLENKGKDLTSFCLYVDVNGYFDFFIFFYQFVYTKRSGVKN